MKRKGIVITLAAILLISTLAIGTTLAWLRDDASASNHITIGNVDIQVNEDEWNPDDATDIYPGKTTSKNPSVENIGANPAYIRVKVNIDSAFLQYLTIDYDTDENTGHWYKDGDYYYYRTILLPGEETVPLFTQFTLSSTYQESPVGEMPEFDIIVLAEAIQSQNFEPTDPTNLIQFKDAIKAAFAAYDAD